MINFLKRMINFKRVLKSTKLFTLAKDKVMFK